MGRESRVYYQVKFKLPGSYWRTVERKYECWSDAKFYCESVKQAFQGTETFIDEIEPEIKYTKEMHLEEEANAYHKEH